MSDTTDHAARLTGTLEVTLKRLEQARPFAKQRHQHPVLDVLSRLMRSPEGFEVILERAGRLDAAGLFAGSDWDTPKALLPQLVGTSLTGQDPLLAALEQTSLLRFLHVATEGGSHPTLGRDHARQFLTQVLALNLKMFFQFSDETSRARGDRDEVNARLLQFIAERVGLRDVLGVLVDEIWRILEQRPVQVGPVKDMITQIAVALNRQGSDPGAERLGAERLIGALFGPTNETRNDPGLDAYHDLLTVMDDPALSREAMGFARSLHDTGLVSDYHVAFLNWALDHSTRDLVSETLGLGSTGLDCWRQHSGLIEEIIRKTVTLHTPQALCGLSALLERGVLHHAPVAPALTRVMRLDLDHTVRDRLALTFGDGVVAETILLAGAIEVIGQPLGVGQGANPTCQSARAISMWALIDPDYLLHLITEAAEVDTVQMHFEGTPIDSSDLPAGLGGAGPIDADPVSVLLVPHLDRIYAEMGRLCIGREGDPHRWINPEFHGWWVRRDCLVAVDVATGHLADYDDFIARFHKSYHPAYNGDCPLIHPQPAGIAYTDPSGTFVGWHAITILRVTTGRSGEMRVFFYNPNNDSGQDWGLGVTVSTSGNGERHGEGSLDLEQFVSRLYLFHDHPVRRENKAVVPAEAVARVRDMALASWAADRMPDMPTASTGR